MGKHQHFLIAVGLLIGFIAAPSLVYSFRQDDDACLDRFQAALAMYNGSQARAWASGCSPEMRLQLRSLYQQTDALVFDNNNQTSFLLIGEERKVDRGSASDRESLLVPDVRQDPIGLNCQHPLGSFPVGLWNACCSKVSWRNRPNGSTGSVSSMVIDPFFLGATVVDDPCASFCCELHELSTAALHLPLLDELALRLRVDIALPNDTTSKQTNTFFIQQDGWLRPYEPSTVLWPTGYLLALCLSQPARCGDIGNTRRRVILEIGPGVGAALVVASRVFTPEMIIAVDASTAALALVHDNLLYQSSEVASSPRVILHHANIMTDAVCDRFGPVDMVLVSSVPALLQQHDLLESLLDCWLDSDGVAVIAYSLEQPPPIIDNNYDHYNRVIISARQLSLRTRRSYTSDDDDDEFSIAVLRKAQSNATWIRR